MEKNLGHATAYGYAKSKGYSGTEDEFAELMADYASVGQSAAESASAAAASATSASGSAATASQTAQTATSKASEAVTAASTATTKASEASQSATSANQSAESASTSAQTAATAAATATTKASEASESATTASTAKTDAETARDAAAQSASEAAASAASIDPETLEHRAYGAYVVESATGSIASFPDGADSIPMKDVVVHIEPVQEGSGDPSPDNVRPITGWTGATISHSGADMTNPTTYSITFPSEAGTVYGGTLDVTKGELVVDRAMVDLGSLVWEYNTTYAFFASASLTARKSGVTNMVSDLFKTEAGSWSGIPKTNALWGNASNGTIYIQYPITEVSELLSLIRGHQLVYELATPTTYQLTPQEITSLLGENNLWADTGDTEVEYRASTKMYIDKKITEAVSALS